MAAFGDEEEVENRGMEEDLYLRLNLSRDATTSEITNSYRRLSRIFHPDKHSDETLRNQALVIFHKIQEAHDILTDEGKRAIYDMYGMRGLEMKGWEVIERRPTPEEIREEYERLKRRKEEEKMFARTHPVSKFTFGLNFTDLFDRYLQEPPSSRLSRPHIGVWKMQLFQSVMGHVTVQDSVRVSGTLGKTGKKSGMFQAVWRHLFDHGAHAEVEAGLSGTLFPHVSANYSRPIGGRVVATVGGVAQLVPGGHMNAFVPGLNGSVVVRLAKQLHGRLATKWNLGSMTETEMVWTTEKGDQLIVGSGIGPETFFLKAQYVHNFTSHGATFFAAVKLITEGLVVEYGGTKRVTPYTSLGASLKVGTPIGVMVTLKMTRGSQMFACPVMLSDYLDPVALFYGTVVPIALFYSVKRLVYDPWAEELKNRATTQRRRATAADRADRRREALAAQRLMRETVRRSRGTEAGRSGLLIDLAVYGRAEEIRARCLDGLEAEDGVLVDVTAPLQALVVNSSLVLPPHEARWRLTGFYDPCPDEDKLLLIRYLFRDAEHETVVEEASHIRIPQQRHALSDSDA